MIPVCPSLMCIFNRGDIEGTNSLKVLCYCVCFLLICVMISDFVVLG